MIGTDGEREWGGGPMLTIRPDDDDDDSTVLLRVQSKINLTSI